MIFVPVLQANPKTFLVETSENQQPGDQHFLICVCVQKYKIKNVQQRQKNIVAWKIEADSKKKTSVFIFTVHNNAFSFFKAVLRTVLQSL